VDLDGAGSELDPALWGVRRRRQFLFDRLELPVGCGAPGDLRIIFMGTPAFAVPSLRALLDLRDVAGRAARVVAVVTQPDRPAGRGNRNKWSVGRQR